MIGDNLPPGVTEEMIDNLYRERTPVELWEAISRANKQLIQAYGTMWHAYMELGKETLAKNAEERGASASKIQVVVDAELTKAKNERA